MEKNPKNPLRAPTNAVTVGADGKPFVDPVFAYKTLRGRNTDPEAYGVTITGGYVYRGKAVPALVGKYVFADWSRSMAIADGTLRSPRFRRPAPARRAGLFDRSRSRILPTDESSPSSGRSAKTKKENFTCWPTA